MQSEETLQLGSLGVQGSLDGTDPVGHTSVGAVPPTPPAPPPPAPPTPPPPGPTPGSVSLLKVSRQVLPSALAPVPVPWLVLWQAHGIPAESGSSRRMRRDHERR